MGGRVVKMVVDIIVIFVVLVGFVVVVVLVVVGYPASIPAGTLEDNFSGRLTVL